MSQLRVHVLYPNAGTSTVHELPPGVHVVGSSAGCDVRVNDPRLSRRHAQLRVDDAGLWARDLGSTNGTYLDGVRVAADEVRVPTGGTLVMGDVILRRDDGIGRDSALRWLRHSHPAGDRITVTIPADARDRFFGLITGLFELLATPGEIERASRAICEFAALALRADHVAILMRGEEIHELKPVAGWPARPETADEVSYSRGLIRRVLDQQQPLLVPAVEQDAVLARRKSRHGLSTAMAVPLFENQHIAGVLYLDCSDRTRQFSQIDLDVAMIVANAAAVRLGSGHMAHEMAGAAMVQRAALPASVPELPGYELLAHHVMSRVVGGDLYDALPRPDGTLLLVLGDVAGTGLPAAMSMTACVAALRVLADIGGPVVQLTRLLDKHLARSYSDDEYVTAVLGEFDPATGALQYVNAGHPAPRLVRPSGRVTQLSATRTILGSVLSKQQPLPTECRDIRIEPGDLLVGFSDGLTEASRDGEHQFGERRLDALLRRHRAAPLPELRDRILGAVEEYMRPEALLDDLTLVMLRRT